MILGGMQREGEAPPLPGVLCNNTPLAPAKIRGQRSARFDRAQLAVFRFCDFRYDFAPSGVADFQAAHYPIQRICRHKNAERVDLSQHIWHSAARRAMREALPLALSGCL